jgi:hypothetical protein
MVGFGLDTMPRKMAGQLVSIVLECAVHYDALHISQLAGGKELGNWAP